MAAVMIIMGSISDAEIVNPCMEVLTKLDIDFTVHVSSAHRTPQRTSELVENAENSGTKVFICAAGMAAHLAGAVAAHTTRPVLAIPVAGSSLAGMDALFSTVQMPAGFPVATLAINGAKNAAWLAAQILALSDPGLQQKLRFSREEMQKSVEKDSARLEEKWNNK